MPQVYRIIWEDDDGLPHVASTANGLVVRPGVDIDLSDDSHVLVNGKGTSVNPDWRNAPLFRVPERLQTSIPGAHGSNTSACFRFGQGAFHQMPFAAGLILEPDSPTHGTIAPAEVVSLADYQSDLAATRPGWTKEC